MKNNAVKEQRLSFRNKYLALIVSMLFFSFSYGQVYQTQNSFGFRYKRIIFDSVMAIPKGLGSLRSLPLGSDTAQIRYNKADSSIYVHSGSKWLKSGGGINYPNTTNKYLNGYGAFTTLNTDSITEGSSNLFWTNARGDARYPLLTGSYANPSWVTSLAWTKITGAPAFITTETDPTISTIIKNIPVTTDATTNKYLNWNGTAYVRSQVDYSQLSGIPAGQRFGVEDSIATQNRFFNAKNKLFAVDSASVYRFKTWTPYYPSALPNGAGTLFGIEMGDVYTEGGSILLSAYPRASVNGAGSGEKSVGVTGTTAYLSNIVTNITPSRQSFVSANDNGASMSSNFGTSSQLVGEASINVYPDSVLINQRFGDIRLRNLSYSGAFNKVLVQDTLTGRIYRQNISAGGTGANALGTYIVQTATNAPANAQVMATLGTGIIKNTTTTGVQSIAVAADFPTLNQNTTGSAATVTTNANLTGDVTSVGNATTLATVNANIGTWNNVTVNGKGLVTAGSNVAYEAALGNPTTNGYVLSSTTLGARSWVAGGGGVNTMAAIGSTPNSNGASISGNTLTLQPASSSFGGVITTGTQGFAGAKTFFSPLRSTISMSTVDYTIEGTQVKPITPPSNFGIIYQKADKKVYWINDLGTEYDLTATGAGVSSITGTANQVIASAATGAVTLSLPQSIATTSNVVFNQVEAKFLVANSAAGTFRGVSHYTSSALRWLSGSNEQAELGSNSGSDYAILRYSDAQTFLGNAFNISRATGAATFENTVKANSFINTVQPLTDAATVTWNAALGTVATVTLAGNRTLSITNPVANTYYQLTITQDVTGTRTIILPAGSKVIGGGAGAVILTTTASAKDILTAFFDGSFFYWNIGKNYN